MPEDPSLIYQIERIHNEGPTKSFKLLGVLFDEFLSFEPHISLVCSKVSKALICINRIKNFIHQKSLISLYYAMIHSHLNYCLNVQYTAVRTPQTCRDLD